MTQLHGVPERLDTAGDRHDLRIEQHKRRPAGSGSAIAHSLPIWPRRKRELVGSRADKLGIVNTSQAPSERRGRRVGAVEHLCRSRTRVRRRRGARVLLVQSHRLVGPAGRSSSVSPMTAVRARARSGQSLRRRTIYRSRSARPRIGKMQGAAPGPSTCLPARRHRRRRRNSPGAAMARRIHRDRWSRLTARAPASTIRAARSRGAARRP